VFYDAAQIAAAQRARDANSAQRREEGAFISYPEARRRFGFRQSWLYAWHTKDCRYLRGARLEARRESLLVNGGVRRVWVYRRDQLEEIAKVRSAGLSGVLTDDEGTWLSAGAAKKVYGVWDASLGDWRQKPCEHVGRTIRAKPIRRQGGKGPHKTRWVYHEEDLQVIAAAQAAPGPATLQDSEGTWLFASEVQRRFGWPADGLTYYRRKAWPCLDGGKLRAKQVPSTAHPGMRNKNRPAWVYHEEDLRRLAAFQAGEDLGPIPATPDGPSRQATESLPPPKSRRGRKSSGQTWNLYQFCYEQLAAGLHKRRSICVLARERFPGFNLTEADVTSYARRYAKAFGKPWPV
jgi:hypothetical protein